MENNIDIVVEISETLKASCKGRYLENIAKICQTKHGWSEDTTKLILEEAVKQNRIQTTIVNNKISYRRIDNTNICIEDDCKTTATQTDQLFLSNFVNKDDFIEFKQFAHSEILSMKADIANRRPSPLEKTRDDRYHDALVACLQDRIGSLEKQLQDKQFIIEKLLEGHRPSIPSS